MTPDILMVLAVLGGAIALFVTDWLRVDLVAVLVLLALALTGLVTPAQAVSGFSSPAAVTICGIFILSAGLQRTGVASSLGRWVEQLAGGSEGRLMVALMGTAAVLSFFMNTIAIVALFLPAVMDLSRRTGHAPSRLLMPLAFGALLGGLTTMFATLPNLLASTALKDAGLRPFGLFDFLPVGGAAALAGILYMVLVGRRFLPVRRLDPESALGGGVNLRDFYQLHERMFVLRLPPGSSLRNRTLEESLLGSALGLHVVGILRDGQTQLAPDRATVLRDQDRLLIQGRPEQLDDLQAWRGLTLGEWASGFQQWLSTEVEFVEMRLTEQSRFLGQTPSRFDARRAWGVNILAIRRGGEVRRSHLREWRLQAGDRLLAQAPRGRSSGLGELVGADEVQVLPLDVACSAYDLHARLFTLRVPRGRHWWAMR